MTSVRTALILSFIERYALIALSLISNILLARLLTPEQIGIYSVSMAVIGIAQVLRDFGIGNFLIQEKNLEDAHIKTAFGFSLLLGSSLFLITYLLAPIAGNYYSESRMIETMHIVALNFLVLPFCSISLALLRREMAFKKLMSVNLIAASISFCITIGLAYQGFGPNSMAIGAVASNLITGIGAWSIRTERKLLLPGFSEWRILLRFSAQNSLANIITTISMDINDLVLGKILGFSPVAIISRAQGLMNLFHRDLMGAVRNVAYPAYARTFREGGDVEASHVYSVAAVTVIAWPFYGFTALYSLEVLRLMFGPQWDEAADLVPIFCLAGATAAISNLVLTAILAVGRVDIVTKAELIFQPVRAIIIVGIAIIYKSLFICAVAYFISFIINTAFVYLMKQACIPNNYRQLLKALWLSLKVTVFTLIFPLMLWMYTKTVSFSIVLPLENFSINILVDRNIEVNLALLSAIALLTVLSWFFGLIIFKHPVSTDPIFKKFVSKTPILT